MMCRMKRGLMGFCIQEALEIGSVSVQEVSFWGVKG